MLVRVLHPVLKPSAEMRRMNARTWSGGGEIASVLIWEGGRVSGMGL